MADIKASLLVAMRTTGADQLKAASLAFDHLQHSAKAAAAAAGLTDRQAARALSYKMAEDRRAISMQLQSAKIAQAAQARESFGNRARGALSGMRDMTVAAYGMYGGFRLVSGAIASAITPLRHFQTSMAQARAKGMSAADAADVSALALRMGKNGQFSPTQIAEASVELAAAGLTSAGDQQKALPSVLRFSQASGLGTERSAGLLVETAGQFGLSAKDFEQIGDRIQKAADASTISVGDLAESLKYAGPAARAAGQDLATASSAIALLGEKGGLKGSEGGTAYAGIISRMARPRKLGLTALASLGLSKKDTQEGLKDMPAFFAKLGAQMDKKKLNEAQRLEKMGMIFGDEQAKAALTFINVASKEIKTWRDLDNSVHNANGTLQRTADLFENTLDGRIKRFNASLETSKIEVIDKFLPALNAIIPAATRAGAALGAFAADNTGFLSVLAGGAGLAGVGRAGVSIFGGLGRGLANVTGNADTMVKITSSSAGAGVTAGTAFAAAFAAAVGGYALGSAILEWTKNETRNTNFAEDFGAWMYDLMHNKASDHLKRQEGQGVDNAQYDPTKKIEKDEMYPEAIQENKTTGTIEVVVRDERVKVTATSKGPTQLRTGSNPSAPSRDLARYDYGMYK